jgi:hypothetical protein
VTLATVKPDGQYQAEACGRCDKEPASPMSLGFCRGCYDDLARMLGPGVWPPYAWRDFNEMFPYDKPG